MIAGPALTAITPGRFRLLLYMYSRKYAKHTYTGAVLSTEASYMNWTHLQSTSSAVV